MTAFVLVGGPFTGGWMWEDVAGRLREAGERVWPVTLDSAPGAGLSTHIAELSRIVDQIEVPRVVLVGHDYGIHPVLGAADRCPERISRVVHVAAGLPRDGDTARRLVRDETVRARLAHDDAPVRPPRGRAWERWGSTAGLSAEALARLDRLAVPQPAATFTEPLRLTGAAHRLPATAVLCTADGPGIDTVDMLVRSGPPQFRELAGPRVSYFELPTGHWPMLSRPDGLAQVLIKAAAGEGHRIAAPDDEPGGTRETFLLDPPEAPRERIGRLDLHLPEADRPRPAVLFVHGGPVDPTRRPTPRDTPFFLGYGRFAASRGVVGATLDHRLHALTDYAKAAEDVAAAVDQVRADPRVDPDRIALWFFSAGGLLAADWLAAPPPWLRCLALTYPVLAPPPGWETVDARFRPVAALRGAGPLNTVLTRAGLEHPSFAATVRQFLDAATECGATVEVLDVPHGRHGFELLDHSEESRAAVERAMTAVTRLLDA
ncbi:Dienelactone hydrolase family protein [Streptomyces sp. 2231.1]|uniref:dienelactone hydrolase family protein n=1 Tax=Streptomyces sp. 2231.1 TaxID=1855347 RepID=UPI00089B0392|nr:dienelactone hydrolase family protein [Streptomyces sp. 2231.1]SEC14842.1 Dienelactone hydrolase family protein [Streptomyces sp. 2231.1]